MIHLWILLSPIFIGVVYVRIIMKMYISFHGCMINRIRRLFIEEWRGFRFNSANRGISQVCFFFLASSLSMDFDDESLQHSTFFSSDSNSSFRTHRFEIFRLRWKLLGVLFSYGLSKIILQSCFIYYYQGCKNYNRISQLFRGLLSIEITY